MCERALDRDTVLFWRCHIRAKPSQGGGGEKGGGGVCDEVLGVGGADGFLILWHGAS